MQTTTQQTHEAPADRSTTVPVAVTVASDRRSLTLLWASGEAAILGAGAIRQACRCAWCRRDRILGCFPIAFEDIAVSHLDPVGGHALHIAFSDGHARGLFPWTYLRDLADGGGSPEEGLAATHLLGCPTTGATAPSNPLEQA